VFRDPYLRVAWRETNRKWRDASAADMAQQLGFPLLAVLVLLPLVRRTFLAFLDDPADTWDPRVVEVVFRANLLALSVVVLDLYEQVVRGRERAVLQILPVNPAAVARLAGVRAFVGLHRWVAGGAVLLFPIALGGRPGLWVASVLSAWACAWMAVPLGIAGHLLAIRVAEWEAAGPLLDLIRGGNPRAQAALLYGPGATLLVGGAALRLSAEGVPALAGGAVAGWLVVLPVAVGAAVAFSVAPLARLAWFRGSAVISEIDARYAALEDPTEALRVYLEWAVRFVPERARVYALADLRHGWRARRTLLSLQWVAAVLAFGLGWTTDPGGPFRAAAMASAAVALVGAVGVGMDVDEPGWLRLSLPRHPTWSRVGRAAALVGWALPAPVLAAVGVGLRRGAPDAALVLGTAAAAAVVAITASLLFGPLRERGMRGYVPLVTVAVAGLLAGFAAVGGAG
jgi:hypothetical protein